MSELERFDAFWNEDYEEYVYWPEGKCIDADQGLERIRDAADEIERLRQSRDFYIHGCDVHVKRSLELESINAELYEALDSMVRILSLDVENGAQPWAWTIQALVDKAQPALAKARGEGW
ncbi:MAG: hypothetical protein ACRC16_22025 [Aeromonas salmonicida]